MKGKLSFLTLVIVLITTCLFISCNSLPKNIDPRYIEFYKANQRSKNGYKGAQYGLFIPNQRPTTTGYVKISDPSTDTFFSGVAGKYVVDMSFGTNKSDLTICLVGPKTAGFLNNRKDTSVVMVKYDENNNSEVVAAIVR